ncbi:MAG: hypothetical protein ABSA30_04845, partial [Candidatus Aminicenantales bacterium]
KEVLHEEAGQKGRRRNKSVHADIVFFLPPNEQAREDEREAGKKKRRKSLGLFRLPLKGRELKGLWRHSIGATSAFV